MRLLAVASVVSLAACRSGAAHSPPTSPGQPEPPAVPISDPGSTAPIDRVVPVRPAPAATQPVTHSYHGVEVVDRYEWLEGDGDPVAAWSDAQNDYASDVLQALPGQAALAKELTAIIAAPATRYGGFHPVAGQVFGFRKRADRQQFELVRMPSPERADDARLVLDPSATDEHTTIDWFEPSPDGTRVAVSLSSGGSEEGTLHIIDLDGKDLEPPIPNVNRGTGGGSVAWRPDGKLLWYTRYPGPGDKPDSERDFWMQVWSHTLGTPAARDHYELGKDFPQIAEVKLAASANGRLLASVQNGDGGTFRHYVRTAKGRWSQLTHWDDHVVHVSFGPRDRLWLVSLDGAPHGRILTLPAGATSLAKARVVVAESADTIVTNFADAVGPTITTDRIYVGYQQGGPSTIRAFTWAGKPAEVLTLPAVATVALAQYPIDNDLLVFSTSYVQPPTWGRYVRATNVITPIAALSPPTPVDLRAFEVHREMATSLDGTQIPVNIVWKTGAPKDGTSPCLITGYGGYGVSEEPYYAADRAPLLDRGVCYVTVNLRGGGEFGEDWHRAGALTHKQNVFDDMAAAIDTVVAHGYSRNDRIAIEGGSNGGLLMGAVLTQHPDKIKAVVAEVGIYDMLRVELSPNGAYNTTEFGTVADPDQWRAMYAYSPYHHVVAGTRYPAVLMTTGANDPRVAPWQSRKMVAALQAAQAGDAPILLRTSATSGHGVGTAMSERIAQLAEIDAFVLWQLDVEP
jgi:prolyl oligopeptidase